MSINHARQKRNNKKCSTPSTAAVYPIVQNLPNASVPDIATSAVSTTCFVRGQCVRARAVAEANLVSSVAELVSEVIPQGSAQSQAQNEPVYWVKIQKCITDLRGRQTTHAVVLGLARGYQIWMILDNGDCEEVVSERKGPLKVGHLLPFVTEGADRFRDQRPLFALVDGNPMSAERKFCSVTFLSLKQGKTDHALNFENPIIDLESSVKCLLVVFAESIVICDQETLTQRYCVVVPPSPDMSFSPNFALSDNLLAFADSSVNKDVQSCGGAVFDDELSYGGQMMSAAKSISKTVTSISESFVSSFSANGTKSGSIKDPGIVSVIDVSALSACDEQVNHPQHYVAHFVAHDCPVGFIAFGNGGQLVFTSNLSATTFHLFLLQPHPTPTLSSVQHLYTLHRGNSIAKVIDCAFSADNRWLSVSTNHGTTHVFAITPYGGPISMRTHGGKFVNKESRFERTAGLTAEHVSRTVHHSSSRGNTLSSPTFKEHPSMTNAVVARTVVNPRITLYASPVVLWSIGKIKQRPFSAGNLSAWASDNAIVSLGSNRQNGRNSMNVAAWLGDSSRRISSAFGTPSSNEAYASDYPTLTVMNAEGILTQYRIEIRRERHNSSGSTSSLNVNDVLSSSPAGGGFHPSGVSPKVPQAGPDAPVRIKVIPISQWALNRNKGASGVDVIDPPLHESNPILRVLNGDRSTRKWSKKEPSDTAWLPHVEVLTYSGPHRRLWMGPQFSFGIYAPSGHSSAQLFNPNDSGGVKVPYLTAQKCCPVLIEKNSPALGILNCETSCDTASRIVCGSWSSELDFKTAFDDGASKDIRSRMEKISDAMQDMDFFDEPATDSASNKSDSPSSGTNQDLLMLSGMEL